MKILYSLSLSNYIKVTIIQREFLSHNHLFQNSKTGTKCLLTIVKKIIIIVKDHKFEY